MSASDYVREKDIVDGILMINERPYRVLEVTPNYIRAIAVDPKDDGFEREFSRTPSERKENEDTSIA